MTTRSVKAAKAALVSTPAKGLDMPYDAAQRIDIVTRLTSANAKERILILSALPLGEVAAIGGKVASIGASVNEVLNIKLCEKHGADWAHIAKALPADLCEADKTRRKAINASLEAIRETVKANAAGDAQKAAETVRRVKEWGLGIRQSKSKPKANEKRGLQDFLLSWDAMPATYRRIMKDEEACEADMALADAIAAYFTANKINPRAVLECSGRSAWNK